MGLGVDDGLGEYVGLGELEGLGEPDVLLAAKELMGEPAAFRGCFKYVIKNMLVTSSEWRSAGKRAVQKPHACPLQGMQ